MLLEGVGGGGTPQRSVPWHHLGQALLLGTPLASSSSWGATTLHQEKNRVAGKWDMNSIATPTSFHIILYIQLTWPNANRRRKLMSFSSEDGIHSSMCNVAWS